MGFVDLFHGVCNQAQATVDMTIPVKFPANSFSSTPQVLLSITHHDVGVPTTLTSWPQYRLNVYPSQISSDGFDVNANTWLYSCLWDVGVQWLAILEY
jgi:hypothetical protein